MKCVKCKKRFNPLGMHHLQCVDEWLCMFCYASWLRWYHDQVDTYVGKGKGTLPQVWNYLWQAFLKGKVACFVFR